MANEKMEMKFPIPPNFQEDWEYILKAKEKDQKAYAFLVDKYWNPVFFMLLKMIGNPEDAEDITLEAFHKAFHHLDKYQPNFAFSTWLFRIATNTGIDFLRKKKLQTVALQTDPDMSEKSEIQLLTVELGPEEKYIKKQRAQLIKYIVEQMDPIFRKLLELRYFEELTYEEIAEQLKMPLGTVKVQLHRAKKVLFAQLKGQEGKF
ncbi:MAG: sigma-70 family RNA polymerase sigma factor [Chitinophagales bacterium]|nr:sigma-70 family RNA polymerase sigma factor [Chitinophagales bacterium]